MREIGPLEHKREGTDAAKDRQDLIKRLVPVAISVGFAGRLSNIHWINQAAPIHPDDLEQLIRLFTGVFVVVSGWEWYHRDLRRYPLEDFWRFFLDVTVVIFTIFFLFSSESEVHWLISLTAIFFLYLIWDFLTIRAYKQDFNPSTNPLGYQPLRAPITNFLWLLYFAALTYLNWGPFSEYKFQTFTACLFVALGVVLLLYLGLPSKPEEKPKKMSGGELASAALERVLLLILLTSGYSIVSYIADYIAHRWST